jgi:hypothetical protein
MTPLDPTAWGNSILEIGTPGTGNAMSDTLEQIGYILEETLTIELEDGTELTLYEEGHILRDQLQQEGTVRITGTLIGIPDDVIAKFWQVETEGTGDTAKTWVKSMVASEKYSVRMGTPAVVGSERLLVPYASVNLGVAYSSTQGWTAPFTFTILKGATERMFGFDKVPAPIPAG